MSWNSLARGALLPCALAGAAAYAGTGSEVGQGGFQPPGASRWSVAAQWGASVEQGAGVAVGPPLYVGARASLQAAPSLAVDASLQALLNSGRVQGLVGPRAVVGTRPWQAWLGLKAGAVFIPRAAGGVRFGLSPEAGLGVRLRDAVELGLSGAWDVPLGGDAAPNARVGLEVGWRF